MPELERAPEADARVSKYWAPPAPAAGNRTQPSVVAGSKTLCSPAASWRTGSAAQATLGVGRLPGGGGGGLDGKPPQPPSAAANATINSERK
jgi:hypothetical protein